MNNEQYAVKESTVLVPDGVRGCGDPCVVDNLREEHCQSDPNYSDRPFCLCTDATFSLFLNILCGAANEDFAQVQLIHRVASRCLRYSVSKGCGK